MADRFLALIGLKETLRDRGRLLAGAVSQAYGLVERVEQPTLKVLVDPTMPARWTSSRLSLVLGDLFESRSGHPDAPEHLCDHLLEGDGTALLEGCWGGYIAISYDPLAGRSMLLRDPSGVVPVYFTQTADFFAFASDLAIFKTLGLAPLEVSWDFVAHHLAFPELRLGATGLTGIRELLAGEAANIVDDRLEVRPVWTPQRFARQISAQTFEESAANVEAAVRGCVVAMTRKHRRLALQLSGGLDSSIVAGCLNGSSAELLCINLATAARDGDERLYADAAAKAGGWPLQVLPLQPGPMKIEPADPGFRPGPASLFRDVFRIQSEAAAAFGASAMLTGGGGDNVFSHLLSPALAADRLATQGPGPAFWRCSAEIASIGRSTMWAVATKAMRQVISERGLWRPDGRFLGSGTIPATVERHVWHGARGRDLPGRRRRIDSILGVQSLLDPAQRPSAVPMQHPLLAQPVIEACLRIPSWHWVRGGVDRAVARAAFGESTPQIVLKRRGKGSMNSYFSEIYRMSRPQLADLLLDGVLAQRGLLDVAAVRNYLAHPGPPRNFDFYRLLALADVEIWLRAWAGA